MYIPPPRNTPILITIGEVFYSYFDPSSSCLFFHSQRTCSNMIPSLNEGVMTTKMNFVGLYPIWIPLNEMILKHDLNDPGDIIQIIRWWEMHPYCILAFDLELDLWP